MLIRLQLPPPGITFFFQGETLGEVKAGEEEVVSAADWVNRSRRKAVAIEEERLLAKKRERYVIVCAGIIFLRFSMFDGPFALCLGLATVLGAWEAGERRIIAATVVRIFVFSEVGRGRGTRAFFFVSKTVLPPPPAILRARQVVSLADGKRVGLLAPRQTEVHPRQAVRCADGGIGSSSRP